MRLDHVTLFNFGPLREVALDLVPGFNVVAGVNGAGKTSILNAISIMLARYASAVRYGRAVRPFPADAIREGQGFVRAIVDASDEGATFTWSGGRARRGNRHPPENRSGPLLAYAERLASGIAEDPERAGLPIVAFYPVNRSVLDIPLRIRTKIKYQQYAALDDSLLQGPRNFRTFFAWFRDREDVENERRIEDRRHRDRQLSAVRTAIDGLLPGFSDLRVRRQPLRMLITKNGEDLRVDQLSDGEKCMLALAGDLARRLAIANPGSRHPLQGKGVILIDEIELHLHPAWQRLIVQRLREIFPNCQFIVTTHSPQVLSEVTPEAIFLLSNGCIFRPTHSLGRDSNLILEELMGATRRPEWAEEEIRQLYEEIDDDRLDEARQQLHRMEERLGGNDPALSAARVVLARRRSAG